MGPHLPRRENFGNLQRSFHFQELGEANYSWDMADADFDFLSMFHLEFLAGRDFSKDNPADTAAVILNEAAIRELGITPEKALSLQADEISYYEENGKMIAITTKHKVIGVVKDYNYASVRNVYRAFCD